MITKEEVQKFLNHWGVWDVKPSVYRFIYELSSSEYDKISAKVKAAIAESRFLFTK